MSNTEKIILTITALSVVILTACTKPIIEPPCVSEPQFYKMSLREDGTGTFFKLFTYYNSDKLVKTEHENAYVEYTYGINNKVEQYKISYKNGSPSQTASIFYQPYSGNIHYIRTEYPHNNILEDSAVFEYRNDSISKITHYTSEGIETGSNEFFYDTQGNVLKEKRIFNGVTEVLEYTYDVKINPWRVHVPNGYHPLLGVICPNNVLSLTYRDSNGITDQDKSYTTIYTYDNNTSPLSAQFIFLNGKTENYTIEYQ